ncbi:hypothetical protein H0H93_002750, partial [Arthromyces matolae]
GSMRKRFGNALTWYNALLDKAATFVDEILNKTRYEITGFKDGMGLQPDLEDPVPSSPCFDYSEDPTPNSSPSLTFSPQTGSKRTREDEMEDDNGVPGHNPFKDALPRERPSDYL